MLLNGSAVIGPQKTSPPPTLSKELVDLPPPRSLLQSEHVKNMDVPRKAGWGLVVVDWEQGIRFPLQFQECSSQDYSSLFFHLQLFPPVMLIFWDMKSLLEA